MARGDDRRVRRTRQALQGALFELVTRRDYETITVADICEVADVGRSAFYQHFKGKDDLLRAAFERLEADMDTAEAGFSAGFLDHAYQHRALYRGMMRSQAAPIVSTAIRRILGSKAKELLASESASGAPRDLRSALLVDMLFSLTRWWLDRDAPQSVEEIDTMFRELAVGIVGGPDHELADQH